MKTYKFLLVIVLLISVTSCTGYGEKLKYNGTEVYYLNSVTKAEAEQLGVFLVDGKFADGNPKSVQLSRNPKTNTLTFKMVVNPDVIDNSDYAYTFKSFTTELMNEFDAEVDFHLTDETFDTIKVFLGKEQAKSIMALKTEVRYMPEVEKQRAQKLADYLKEHGFANEKQEKTVKLEKENDVFLFKMVVSKRKVDDVQNEFILRYFGIQISENVFPNDSLRVQMCDDRFNVLKDLK